MEFMDELENLGVDITEGLDRVMGDESLYKMMLGMFVDAIQNAPIRTEEFEKNELNGLIEKVHTLKGTAGNLSILPLYTRYTEMLTLLRAGKTEEARGVFAKTVPVQNNIVACIQRHRDA